MSAMIWSELLTQERLRHPEYDEQSNRPLYTQDADRLVFSAPFRRLANKTQVHPLYDHDHIHHRLIHSIETSMVGRSLGMSVGDWLEKEHNLKAIPNVDKHTLAGTVQAACLAHDIGNPPFGHSGEDAIGTWFAERFEDNSGLFSGISDGVSKELSKFEGNAQGFRLIAKLEMYRGNGGMQLSFPVLGSFQKYPARARTSDALGRDKYVGLKKFGVFEAEWEIFQEVASKLGLASESSDHGAWFRRHPLVYLVEAADDICYEVLDLEDAFVSGDLSEEDVVNALMPIASPNREVEKRSGAERIAFLRAVSIGKAVNACVEAFKENYDAIMIGEFNSSLIEASSVSLPFSKIHDLAKKRIFTATRKTELEVAGRSVLRTALSGLKPIYEDLYSKNWDVGRLSSHHQQLVRALKLDLEGVGSKEEALHSLADFVSGMTDRYAVKVSRLVSGIQ